MLGLDAVHDCILNLDVVCGSICIVQGWEAVHECLLSLEVVFGEGMLFIPRRSSHGWLQGERNVVGVYPVLELLFVSQR